ncbi:MAG: hypothetical protein HYV07_22785 [Deltaproteobacteria bacterium]|nr:hypothetical protein [Deltaproteobacteria bacterium]
MLPSLESLRLISPTIAVRSALGRDPLRPGRAGEGWDSIDSAEAALWAIDVYARARPELRALSKALRTADAEQLPDGWVQATELEAAAASPGGGAFLEQYLTIKKGMSASIQFGRLALGLGASAAWTLSPLLGAVVGVCGLALGPRASPEFE